MAKIFRNVFILFLILHQSVALLSFRFKKAAFTSYIGFRTNVPTVFQCAELCLAMKICKSLNFDNKKRICHISTKEWTFLTSSTYVLYAKRDDLAWELASSCENHTCGTYQFCQQKSAIHHTCIPYYQCLDGSIVTDNYCPVWSDRGGCDEANVNTYIYYSPVYYTYWTYGNWLYMERHCKRSCRLCVEKFANN